MEFVIDLYEQLETALQKINIEADGILDIARSSLNAAETSMEKLKAFIAGYEFKDTSEEIYFFKDLKPKFYSYLIYNTRLFEIETNRPEGSPKAQRKYLNKRLSNIERYGEDHQAFYKYYRSKATYLDDAYFTRDRFDLSIGFDMSYWDCDQRFCTSHDFMAANFIANERLVNYLNKSMFKIESANNEVSPSQIMEELNLSWVETKIALVEMIYGLQSQGAFYNNKTKERAEVREIALLFERVFNMELGNIYRSFQEIRIRKKTQLSFLERTMQSLKKRIDELDDK